MAHQYPVPPEAMMAAKAQAESVARAQGYTTHDTLNLDASAFRPSARAALRERIERLQREAKALEALDRALPLELPPAADEALWQLFVSR